MFVLASTGVVLGKEYNNKQRTLRRESLQFEANTEYYTSYVYAKQYPVLTLLKRSRNLAHSPYSSNLVLSLV